MELKHTRNFAFALVILFASDVSAKKKIGSISNDPFLMQGPGRTKTGFLPDLMDAVVGPGTYKFVQPADGHYGQLDQGSGSWDGLIGMAMTGQVDIVAADLTMTSTRSNVLEFTVPYLSAQVTVLLKKEKKRGGRHGAGDHGRHKFKNVLEMLDNPDFNFMVINGGSTYKFLEQSKIAYQRQIFQRIQGNTSTTLVANYDEGVQRLAEADGHDLGLIAESPGANWRKSKDCKLYSIGNLGERYFGLAVKRSGSSSAVVKDLSNKILELQESGMMTMLIDRYFGNAKCHKKEQRQKQQSQGSSQSFPPWMRSNEQGGGGVGMTPTGYGVMVDKAYFGGEGTCNSMKLDVSDIKAAMHDIKRELNNMKTKLEGL